MRYSFFRSLGTPTHLLNPTLHPTSILSHLPLCLASTGDSIQDATKSGINIILSHLVLDETDTVGSESVHPKTAIIDITDHQTSDTDVPPIIHIITETEKDVDDTEVMIRKMKRTEDIHLMSIQVWDPTIWA